MCCGFGLKSLVSKLRPWEGRGCSAVSLSLSLTNKASMWQQRPASPFQKPIVEYDEKRSILWGRYFEFAKDGSCRGLGGVTGKHQQEREKRGGREGGMLFFFFSLLASFEFTPQDTLRMHLHVFREPDPAGERRRQR